MIDLIKRYWANLFVYVAIGGSAALVEWAIFAVLVLLLDAFHYLPGAIFAFLTACYVNYLLSVRYGFNSRGRSSGAELILVYAVSSIGLAIGLATLTFGTEVLGLHVMISKVAGTGFAFLWNFAGRQFIVFDKNPRWRAVEGRLRDSAWTAGTSPSRSESRIHGKERETLSDTNLH